MRRSGAFVASGMFLALAATAALVAGVQPLGQEPRAVQEVADIQDLQAAEATDLWFVELASPPAADGTARSALQAEHAAFRRAAAPAGVAYQERFAFTTLWNGLSVRIDPAGVAALARLEGVANVYPVAEFTLPEPSPEPAPQLATALAMTGADIVHSKLEYTGAGVKVGIIDTGVDYDHPDLGGCFGPGCRVATGYDFVGDTFPTTAPVPDKYPDDCNGHGTRVAGIVGAHGAVTGVAPEVTFGAYRVFGCTGATSADIMIAAMERALADGMPVVNMSIASASPAAPSVPRNVSGGDDSPANGNLFPFRLSQERGPC